MASNKKMSQFSETTGILDAWLIPVVTDTPPGFNNVVITFANLVRVINEKNGMTDHIYDQLENIGVQTISGTQWGHLSVADQDVGTSHDVTFASVDSDLVDGSTAATQTPGDNSTKVATTAYVDAAVPAGVVWNRVAGAPNYVIPKTAADDIGATGARITMGWFSNLEITNMPTVGGTGLNANGALSLTSAEVTQLANIDTTTISTSQWGNVGAMDQDVATTSDVDFASITLTIPEAGQGGVSIRDADTNPIAVIGDGSATAERGIVQLYDEGTESIRLIAGSASSSWIDAGNLAIGKTSASSLLDIDGLTTTTSLKITALTNDIPYGDSSGTLTGVSLGNQDEPLLSNGTTSAPKFGTMRLAPAPQSAAGATPVDTDVSGLNNDTFGTIVGTGGRVFFFWKNATDVYYVEATAL
jgi:hypothetical protein